MQRALDDEAEKLVEEIVQDLDEKNSQDFGCICEIDLSKKKKIHNILQKIFDEYLADMQKNEEARKDEEVKK